MEINKEEKYYTFHESNVSRRVLHKQSFDPKPTFNTSVLHFHAQNSTPTHPLSERFFNSIPDC